MSAALQNTDALERFAADPAEGPAAPADLASFIVAEVARQGSEDAVRKLVETKIGKVIEGAVDSALRGYGDVGKQIEKVVTESLKLREPLDVPSYGTMVMAVLRKQMDAILTPLVNERLGKEMQEILRVAPAELKLSDVVTAMKGEEDLGERFGSHATCLVETDERGYTTIHLDPDEPRSRFGGGLDKLACGIRLDVTKEGKIYHLVMDGKDPKSTIVMGAYAEHERMIFAAYACGSKFIVDEDDCDTGYGDF